jgi:hypothetical protein
MLQKPPDNALFLKTKGDSDLHLGLAVHQNDNHEQGRDCLRERMRSQ